jgi:hypothetical protein
MAANKKYQALFSADYHPEKITSNIINMSPAIGI